MQKPWKKYIDAFKNADKIAEGIKNNIFKKEHKGDDCLAPGTQPCCGDCGCSLAFKVRSLSSDCPKGFWDALTTEEQEGKINQQIKK